MWRPVTFRTFVALVYLAALTLHGQWDAGTAVLAVAVLAVWAMPAVRIAISARSNLVSH